MTTDKEARWIIRILTAMVICLALMAGYLWNERQKLRQNLPNGGVELVK